MKTHDIMEWYSADELHEASQNWLIELKFIKDEHLFFEDIFSTFSVQLIEAKGFEEKTEIIDAINESQRSNNSLIKEIKKHDKDLRLLVDGIDQREKEMGYKREHRKLMAKVDEHLKEYKLLKTQLFSTIKELFKIEKLKKLMA